LGSGVGVESRHERRGTAGGEHEQRGGAVGRGDGERMIHKAAAMLLGTGEMGCGFFGSHSVAF